MENKPHYTWQFQRLSALFLVFTLPIFLMIFYSLKNATYQQIILRLQTPWVPVLISLIIMASLYHALLGIQVISRDYLSDLSASVVVTAVQMLTVGLMVLSLFSLTTIIMGP